MVLWQALVLGGLQGVAELFPVSSLAQTIIIPALLKWHLGSGKEDDDYLAFVVALHLATAFALIVYFWRDWCRVIGGAIGGLIKLKPIGTPDARLAWLLVTGTLVVGAVGKLAEKHIGKLFDDPKKAWIVAAILVVNGFIMLLGDFVKRRAALAHPTTEPEHVPDEPIKSTDHAVHNALNGAPVTSVTIHARPKGAEDMSFLQAFFVGAAQVLALLPGISRSGVTIIGGLWAGLTYEQASRFSFMLATPVIMAAALLKVPKLLHEPKAMQIMALKGSGVAFVAAFLSIAFLMKYFHTNRLSPFGYFCILFGGGAAVWLHMHPAM